MHEDYCEKCGKDTLWMTKECDNITDKCECSVCGSLHTHPCNFDDTMN